MSCTNVYLKPRSFLFFELKLSLGTMAAAIVGSDSEASTVAQGVLEAREELEEVRAWDIF